MMVLQCRPCKKGISRDKTSSISDRIISKLPKMLQETLPNTKKQHLGQSVFFLGNTSFGTEKVPVPVVYNIWLAVPSIRPYPLHLYVCM